MHRGERVMRRVPALLFLVPLEHRKIDYPEELEIARIEQLVPVLKLLRAKEAELPASLLDRFFGAMALGFAGRGSQNQEIVFAGGAALPHAVHSGWMVPDRKSTRLNSSHMSISYAVFCLKKKKIKQA